METFFILIIVVAILFAIVAGNKNKTKKIRNLKLAYERSLKEKNKKAALDAGRAYYGALRENKALTIYDEQAITNDLSTMSDSTTV